MTNTQDELVQKARQIVEHVDLEEVSPKGIIAREIALTLETMDRLHHVYTTVEQDLFVTAAQLGSELLQAEAAFSRFAPQRAQLQAKLLGVKQEQRRVLLQKEQEYHALKAQFESRRVFRRLS